MKPSISCLQLIKNFEGLFLHAYPDPIDIWTIGYGTIQYPDGRKVKKGDTCTKEQAEEWLKFEVDEKAWAVSTLTDHKQLTQGQFDALVSFAYNLGTGSLQKSTLLKKLKINPSDPTIYTYTVKDETPVVRSCEFLKWVFAGEKILPGLVRRRAAEADMYKS